MKNEKYVKLSAIERMAEPMEALHEEGEYDEMESNEHVECKCPCCGAPCESCNEADEEDKEEYDEEDSEDE